MFKANVAVFFVYFEHISNPFLVFPLLPMNRQITTHCHSLSLVFIRCNLLSLFVPLVFTLCTTRFHSLCHSLSFFVTHCHSLPLIAQLIVSRFITRLSFNKRSGNVTLNLWRNCGIIRVFLFNMFFTVD